MTNDCDDRGDGDGVGNDNDNGGDEGGKGGGNDDVGNDGSGESGGGDDGWETGESEDTLDQITFDRARLDLLSAFRWKLHSPLSIYLLIRGHPTVAKVSSVATLVEKRSWLLLLLLLLCC